MPNSPYVNTGLVVIDGRLTAIGGDCRLIATNKWFTFRQEKWEEEEPPMPTARSQSAVVATPDSRYVVVIGGNGDRFDKTTAVEALHVPTKTWCTLTPLPRDLYRPSATVCEGTVHVIGGSIGFSFSIKDLPSEDKQVQAKIDVRWTKLPKLPVNLATAATISEKLVAICGWKNGRKVSSIHQLADGEWVEIWTMNSGQHSCLVASRERDRMIIVGIGREDSHVEECIAQPDCTKLVSE